MSKSLRRSLVMVLTVIALLLVISGLFFDSKLASNPLLFCGFWGGCLVVVCVILIGAMIDIRSVRKEFKTKQADLDQQLADSLAEAKKKQSKQK